MFMAQTTTADSTSSTSASLGAAAAAAALTATDLADDTAALLNGDTDGDAEPDGDGTTEGDAAGGNPAKRQNTRRKIAVVVGEMHLFDTVAKAEKFLNAEGAPTAYAVFRVEPIGTNKKVSLR
jgi:hypothetical protein